MLIKTDSRRLLAFALIASFLFSCVAPTVDAQRRRRRRTAQSATRKQPAPPPRNTFEGEAHPRPPRTYDVLNYTIRTRFDVPKRTVIGDETVTLKPLADGFKSFALDQSGMEFESVTLADTNTALEWTTPPGKISITLDHAYAPSDTISIRLQYRVKPLKGLYFIPAMRRAGGRTSRPAQIWTQGEPEENHYWFPCYDFPDDKATSEQYITTEANEIAISNGALIETTENADGTRTFHWKMDQPHSTYLVSMVVGNYVKMTDSYKNVPLEYYTYPGTEAEARRSFAPTPKMMEWFSQVLNYEYPYNKYAQTIVANFIFGGMENITATTHADSEILRGGSDDTELSSENLVSHELSHSWFGDLVTCENWTHLWLNEGFATFFEANYQEHSKGRDAYLDELRGDATTYFMEDAYRYRRPVVYDRYGTPVDLFDSTLYKKGGFIVHMLRETVGDEVFWKALNNYLNEYKYQSVETEDLKRVFEKTSGKQLDWFFDQWLYKAGYPELRVRSTYNPASRQLTLDVTQTQVPDELTPAVFRLPVEIELATAQGARTERIEITQRTQRFNFKLDGQPKMIRFDKGERILKRLDFPQSQEMKSYQLMHSADAIGRIEAAEALARMVDKTIKGNAGLGARSLNANNPVNNREVIVALRQALTNDSYYGVRIAAAKTLAHFSSAEAKEALMAALADNDSRVRRAALTSLATLSDNETASLWLPPIFAQRSAGPIFSSL